VAEHFDRAALAAGYLDRLREVAAWGRSSAAPARAVGQPADPAAPVR
jgi:hypothetical protein